MPWYRWHGIDDSGDIHQGTLWAPSLPLLRQKLLQQKVGLVKATQSFTLSRVSRAEKDAFFEQVATLLCAHIPLYEALCSSAVTQKSSSFKQRIKAVAESVSQGQSFSRALQEEELSDPLCHALVLVGESTGALGPVLKQYSDYRNYQAQSRSALYQALAGPLITLSMFLVIVCSILCCVVPVFQGYFQAHAVATSWSTDLLFYLSRYCTLRAFCVVSSGSFVFVLVCILMGRTAPGRLVQELLVEKIPIVGSLHKKLYVGRTLRTLGMLLEKGVPLTAALTVCVLVIPHTRYRASLTKIKDLVEEGVSLEISWSRSLFADYQVSSFINIGESSATLASMLLCAAELYEKSLSSQLSFLSKLIHPLLLVVLASFIGMLAYSLYVPMLTLSMSISF